MHYTAENLKIHCNNIFTVLKIKASCTSSMVRDNYIMADILLEPGTRLTRLNNLKTEISLLLKTMTPITLTPIPQLGIVRLLGAIGSPKKMDWQKLSSKWQLTRPAGLQVLLGESTDGQPMWMNICDNPHLLIGGSTGSGKSVLLHNIILNLLTQDNVILNLIDTKCVEFDIYKRPAYNKIVHKVVNYIDNALALLQSMIQVMNLRYKQMSSSGLSYGELGFKNIVIVIDEFADLILHSKDFENAIILLAQKARASGIYLIIATQRPSVDIISGSIKVNFPARIACRVFSKFDSRVLLDTTGAENLIGNGDCIVKTNSYDFVRFQSPYVDLKTVN